MNTTWMPWWIYRLAVHWRIWRNTADYLTRRAEFECALLAAKDGLSAEQCRELAVKLGVARL